MTSDHHHRGMANIQSQDHFPDEGHIREVAIHISEVSISKGDKGMIVVGASVAHLGLADRRQGGAPGTAEPTVLPLTGGKRAHAKPPLSSSMCSVLQLADCLVCPPAEDAVAAAFDEEDLGRKHQRGRGASELHELDDRGVDLTMHFSYFAFEGATGLLRWKHEVSTLARAVSCMLTLLYNSIAREICSFV